MKIQCKYSGISFRVEHFSGFFAVDQHPIFNLSSRQLLARCKSWQEMKFTVEDSKLFFLAVMNKTESVVFEYPADPSPSIVANNMQNIVKLLGMVELVETGRLILPGYRVTKDTYKLENIRNWINECFAAKDEWLAPSNRWHLKAKLAGRENVLNKLINSPYKKTEQYAGRLASWAMDAASVPAGLQEYWTKLFKLRDNEIYTTRIVDLEELLEHMEFHLYASVGRMSEKDYQFSDKVLEHLREILRKARAGKIGDLSGGDFFRIVDEKTGQESYANTNTTEQHNISRIAITAPETEPKIADYTGNITGYMKAKAAWTLAQNLRAQNGVNITRVHPPILVDPPSGQSNLFHMQSKVENSDEL